MDTISTQVAVVGSGYWGKNLVRNFHELGVLEYVCDVSDEALKEVQARYEVKTTCSIDKILDDPGIQGVVIAVPAVQHYELVRKCLLRGKDVYVEKPLALHVGEGQKLVQLVADSGRILMVGHILEYHPAIVELKRLIREGHLGRIQYLYSSRLNIGKLRTEENILWSFAPHDISAILFLLDEMPTRVSAHGGSYLSPQIFDTTLTTCDFKNGVKAHIFVSWLHPFKEQKLAIVGGNKMAVFDDMEVERKLTLYSHRIDWVDRKPIAHKDAGQVLSLPNEEPLRRECEHFLQCIRTRNTPRTDGRSALRVMQILEACERSLRNSGQPVELGEQELNYYADHTAIIDEGCEIGEGTKIWHFSHIMSGSRLGKGCNLGQNVVISPDVRIGNNVKIQNNVCVYAGVELEDDVFCGPSMVFTNVINPRSHIIRKHEYKRTLVRQGASIGANATVICGITLGRFSFIGAGAVVTRDVPDYALMVGVPARQIGWMCYCGIRLPDSDSPLRCPSCGRQYSIDDRICTELGVAETEVAKIQPGNRIPLRGIVAV
jgi:UDP-2-acetamido-3-amino-2,3-dideoxy-glucuronate N-acetyltransferase